MDFVGYQDNQRAPMRWRLLQKYNNRDVVFFILMYLALPICVLLQICTNMDVPEKISIVVNSEGGFKGP
jgi:hypothetical protein